MCKRILLIRTFREVGAGGPVPPLGLLYIASAIRNKYGDYYTVKLIDTGVIGEDADIVKKEINCFKPQIIGLSVITCEAEIMHNIASIAKAIDRNIIILAGGPYPTAACREVLKDDNINYVIIGEGEKTIIDLLESLEKGEDSADVKGVSYLRDNKFIQPGPQEYIDNLDAIPFPAWDMIDFREYAKHPNWNGNLKEKYYMPLLTSRGCPYSCIYCHNTLGKKFRARSADNILSEINLLNNKYKIKEFHIYDDVFNLDLERAKNICRLILRAKLKLSFTFPNGLRIDIMDEELIGLLKKIGTYKINYAIETASPDIQEMIKKNLKFDIAGDIIHKTNKSGIITTGYFMLGFPGETKNEMLKTIKFGVDSDLDLAYFFKVTAFPKTALSGYAINRKSIQFNRDYYQNTYFYSREYSLAAVPKEELNRIILSAQKDFYLNLKRILRLILKSPYKLKTIKSLFELWSKIILSYIEILLSDKKD